MQRNKSYEDRTNERLAALGGKSVRQGVGDRWTLTEGTLEMLLGHAEAWRSGQAVMPPGESPGHVPDRSS